ncbi:hypothetical protein CSB80_2132 [Staphylococcus aureus]|nr:hypothetical protein CSB80_2132 [Staphylococcus aureus]
MVIQEMEKNIHQEVWSYCKTLAANERKYREIIKRSWPDK